MRSLERLVRGATAALTVLVLSACNHGTQGCTFPPTVDVPVIVTPVLVSPASGATGVSTGPLDVTIRGAYNATALYLRDGSGNVTNAINFREANPPLTDVRIGTFPQLASQTTYQVYATVNMVSASTNPCGPTPAITSLAPQLLGSFTTG